MGMGCLTVQGRLTRDVEVNQTASGTSVANFGVAWDERADKPVFLDVTAWGGTAEFVAKYFSKGKPILMSGRLSYDTWEKDGQRRHKHYMTAEHAAFVDGAPNDSARDSGDQEDIPF